MVETDKAVARQQRTIGKGNIESPDRKAEDIDEAGDQGRRKDDDRQRATEPLAQSWARRRLGEADRLRHEANPRDPPSLRAKRSNPGTGAVPGLLRRFAPRNDGD